MPFFIDEGLFATITNANFSRPAFIEYIITGVNMRDRLMEQVLNAWKEKKDEPFAEILPECASWRPVDEAEITAKAESGTGGGWRLKTRTYAHSRR